MESSVLGLEVVNLDVCVKAVNSDISDILILLNLPNSTKEELALLNSILHLLFANMREELGGRTSRFLVATTLLVATLVPLEDLLRLRLLREEGENFCGVSVSLCVLEILLSNGIDSFLNLLIFESDRFGRHICRIFSA